MKVFISHSWHNKMLANMTAEVATRSGCEVWQDAHQIQIGENITKAVEDGISNTDAIVLIWSKHAAASENVLFEIATLANYPDKPLIVCNTDDTALPTPYSGIKYISFKDETNGMMRLRVALLMYQLKRAAASGTSYGKVAVDLNAMLEMVNNMIVEKEIKAQGSAYEKDYWINQVVSTSDRVIREFSDQLARMEETKIFMDEIYRELELTFDDFQALCTTYEKAKNYKYADDPTYQGFLAAVENMVKERSKQTTVHPPQTQDTAWLHEFDEKVNKSLVNSRSAIKKYLGWLMPEMIFNPIYESVEYFYTKAIFLLEVLEELEKSHDTKGVFASTNQFLKSYIQSPEGVINDNHLIPLFGITDDIWLIYSLMSDLHARGYLDGTQLGIDWNKVNNTADTLFKIIGEKYRIETENVAASFTAALTAPTSFLPQQQKHPQEDLDKQLQDLERQKQQLMEARIMSLRTDMNRPISW